MTKHIKVRYPLGVFEAAGVEVLGDAPDHPTLPHTCYYGRRWRYRIKYLCCGNENILDHVRLRKRAEDNTQLCKDCAALKRAREKEIPMEATVTWAVPPSVKARG